MKKICVHVVIGVDELMQELLKRTSYMAVSLSSDGAATEGWSDRWILTGDELLWARDRMQEACDRIMVLFLHIFRRHAYLLFRRIHLVLFWYCLTKYFRERMG